MDEQNQPSLPLKERIDASFSSLDDVGENHFDFLLTLV